jgi:drug/metabolite transporter (DMT)-like permease
MRPAAEPAAGHSAWSAGLGTTLAASSAIAFGFGTTFARLAYDGGSNPLSVVTLRFAAFVVVVGLILLALRRSFAVSGPAVRGTLWIAACLAAVSLGYQASVAFIPVSLAALVFYSFPLLVGLAAVAARRDRLNAAKTLALLAAFVGLALALGPGFSDLDWRGLALALLAALGMTLTLTFGGEAMRGEDPLVMAVFTNFWMLVGFAVVLALAGGLALPSTPAGAIGLAGNGLSYVLGYICWFAALGLVKPVRLAALFNIEPLVTLGVAAAILGERLSPLQLLGAALVLAAVMGIARTRTAD